MAEGKKLALRVVSLLLCLVLLTSCGSEGAGYKVPAAEPLTLEPLSGGLTVGAADAEGYCTVAQTEALTLALHPDTLGVRVEDRRSGNVYYSCAESSEGLNKTWTRFMRSGVTIEVMSKEMKLTRVTFAESGAAAEIDTWDGGADVSVSFQEGVSLKLRLDIREGYLKVTVPQNEITEPSDGSLVLQNLYLFPFMGATHGGEVPGYIFLPDGCGALIRTDETNQETSGSYSKRLYGAEMGVSDYTLMTSRPMLYAAEQIYMPVFGVVQEEGRSGVFTVLEEGDVYATLEAGSSGTETPLNYAAARFAYRETYKRYLNQSGTTLLTNQPDRNAFDIVERIYFLEPDEADYSGMARIYQQYLLEKGVLTEAPERASMPLLLETLYSEQKKQMIGSGTVVMTTLEESGTMLEELQAAGITDITLIARGFSKNGAGQDAPTEASFNGKIASRGDWEKFIDRWQSRGVDVGFYADFALGYDGAGGFSGRKDVCQNINERLLMSWKYGPCYYLTPGVVKAKFESGAEGFQKTGSTLLALDTVGSTLYSTWDSRGSASRAQTAAVYASLTREGLRTAFYAPAAYLWQNTAAIYDIPSDSSNYMVFTESVPFMQMVLKGYVEYYDGFSNFHADRRKELLKMAEYGEYPSWIVTGEDSLELLDTASSWLYTSQYDAWREEIAAEYETLAKALNGVLNAHIVRRDEMAKDVYRVRYDNGVEIWVNYSGAAYESGGVRVEALDFAVRQAQ